MQIFPAPPGHQHEIHTALLGLYHIVFLGTFGLSPHLGLQTAANGIRWDPNQHYTAQQYQLYW